MGLLYIGFIAFIAGLLALDLGVFHRKLHVIGVREALGWSAFWISLGVSFSGFIYLGYDQPRAMGHAAQGGRIAAPIFKQFAQVAFKDAEKIPFVAPAGIRMVRIDRVTGKRVFGTFPTSEDPKSSVIWEAFQPETEPRRSFRREDRESSEERQAAGAPKPKVRRAVQPKPTSEDFLQRQGGIY